MSFELSERRRYRRYDFRSPMEYGLKLDATHEVLKAYTVNISNKGVCTYLEGPVRQGKKITIVKCALPFSCETAIVRWASKLDDNTYMAGLECT